MSGTEERTDESEEELQYRKLKAEAEMAELQRSQARTRYAMEMTRTAMIVFSAIFGAIGAAKVVGLLG